MEGLSSSYGDTALVTGASSGFGREFARELAREGFSKIVVVARREARLNALAEELREKHDCEVLVIPQDLTEPGAVKLVLDRIRERGWNVDVLVNNAGTATYGWFGDVSLERELTMMALNNRVPVELTHACLPHMKRQGRGGVINVGGLLDRVKPGTFSAYCGSKAFLATFSECLNEELHGTGVDVVCLVPGYNPDTEIFEAAGIAASFPFPRGKPRDVVRHGLRLLKRKRVVAVDGILNNILGFTLKFTPIRLRQRINKALVGVPEENVAKP